MNYIIKAIKFFIVICVGMFIMIVSRNIFCFGCGDYYESDEEYITRKTAGSFGNVYEEINYNEELENQRIYNIVFNPWGNIFTISAKYTIDTLEGDVLIRVEDPGLMQYSESFSGNALTIFGSSNEENQQYTHNYYDYNCDGKLDCICREEVGRRLEVWILFGKCMVPVDTFPFKSEDGGMKVSAGHTVYYLIGENWLKKEE